MDLAVGFRNPPRLFPTIDRTFLTGDGYYEEELVLDIDYQEADYGNDLDLASPNCEKGSHHDEFINIDDFSLEYLPYDIRHPSVVVWLRYSAQMVVRLSRKANATGRVFVHEDHLNKEYSCSKNRCDYDSVCGNNHSVHGGLLIITNKHVVQNDIEAKGTKVEFFYHNDLRESVVKEYGHTVHTTNHNFDYTLFTCNMHKQELYTHIKMCSDISSFSWRCIPETVRSTLQKFAIVISHPHGTSKKISIGKVVESRWRNATKEAVATLKLVNDLYNICVRNRGLKRFIEYFAIIKDLNMIVKETFYDAATCPGSSGAPVYMGQAQMENGVEIISPSTHRGKHGIGYNSCYT